jgi:hypothetical protein
MVSRQGTAVKKMAVIIGRRLQWIDFLIRPFMRIENISVRQTVCLKKKFHLLHNAWMELEYQVYVCRVVSSVNIAYL